MPIYEYECRSCGRIISALILKKEEEKEVRCPHCLGERLSRVISCFAWHKTEGQRLQEFDPQAAQSEAFYKDRRNIGLWAKKRARELGLDLGRSYDEAVEKARTASTPEDLDLMGIVTSHAALFVNLDPAKGPGAGGIAAIPLDLPGVWRGKPLDKIGQRDLNQGEIFFDNVRIPKAMMKQELSGTS
jgi:putative FmdB family regulatory protein